MVKKVRTINLISNLNTEKGLNSRFFIFNMSVGFFLSKAFRKKGVNCNIVHDRKVSTAAKADHTIAISGRSMLMLRGTGAGGKEYPEATKKKCRSYRRAVEKRTSGKIAVYLDADYSGWAEYFDHVFTVVKPMPNAHKKYVYAGWGADPEYCYPQQSGPARPRAVFLDSLMYRYYDGKFNKIYDIYKETLPKCGLTVYDPIPKYHGTKRIKWTKMQKILGKCHFYCLTQPGEGGLTRIEAATCGALLVVPRTFSKLRSISSLEHRVWDTKADLVKILKTKTNPKAIRKKALAHSWDKTASRILKTLYA